MGDTATLPETLIMAAEQVEAVQPAGAGVEEVVAAPRRGGHRLPTEAYRPRVPRRTRSMVSGRPSP